MPTPGRIKRAINAFASRLCQGLERLRSTGRIVAWPAGLARRFAVLASSADPQHIRLCLDAINTFHPGSSVVLLLDEPLPQWDPTALMQEFPGLAELSIAPAFQNSAAKSGRPDIRILLHPFPYHGVGARGVARLRRADRRIHARRRWLYFRNLELWNDTLACRLLRQAIDLPHAPLRRWLAAREASLIEESVSPALDRALRAAPARLCGHEGKFRVFDAPRAIDFCPDCGMGISSPKRVLSAGWIESTYGPAYALGARYTGWREWRSHCERMVERTQEILQLLGFNPGAPATRPRRVLDVGCGFGRYTRLWVDRGWHYLGLDPSEDNLRFARADAARWLAPGQPEPCFIQGRIDDASLDARAPLDLVIFYHVLEHIPDPGAALRRARQLSAPGGMLFVESPHAASYTWSPIHRGYQNCEHLWDFTPAMLEAVVRAAGWDVMRVLNTPQPEQFPHLALLARNA